MLAFPDGALPLVAGTVLALAGLSVVLSPLLSADDASREADARRADGRRTVADVGEAAGSDEDPGSAIAALREIEFDRATGKLSDSDYAELKTRYTREALVELRDRSRGDAVRDGRDTRDGRDATSADDEGIAGVVDPVEAAIRRARLKQRSCTACGPRPEPDAIYCSHCGRYLPGSCGRCGSPVEQSGARFCAACGEQLAAA